MEEIWKDIKGYEGLYQISNLGNVKSFKNQKKQEDGKVLKPYIENSGYTTVTLCNKGIGKKFKIHKLVAEAFIKQVEGNNIINHKNGTRTDNRVENLEWCTSTYNNTDVYKLRYENKARKKRPIEQYDMKGKLLKTWDSISEASRGTEISYANICSCCKRRQETAGGYIWKYETMLCKHCKLRVDKEDKFCKHCGVKL